MICYSIRGNDDIIEFLFIWKSKIYEICKNEINLFDFCNYNTNIENMDKISYIIHFTNIDVKETITLTDSTMHNAISKLIDILFKECGMFDCIIHEAITENVFEENFNYIFTQEFISEYLLKPDKEKTSFIINQLCTKIDSIEKLNEFIKNFNDSNLYQDFVQLHSSYSIEEFNTKSGNITIYKSITQPERKMKKSK
jgi:hypothetical protein